MTDETKLLGTSGKEAIPFEYQVEEQKIARKRAMAQAMMARSLKDVPAPQMFGKHMANPGIAPHLVNALAMYLGQKGLAGADEDQASMGQRMRADQNAEMVGVQNLMRGQPGQMTPQAGPPTEGQTELPPIEVGGVKPDLRGALVQAMQGRFGSTREYGAQLHKDNQENVKAIATQLGAGDPLAGATFQQGQNAAAPLPAPRQPTITNGQFPGGGNYVASTGLRGGPSTITAEPKPMNVTTTVGGKAEVKLDEANIKLLSDGREAVADVPNVINTVQRIQALVDKGATVGGGASVIQGMRSFAQAFGVSVPEGGLTSELRSKLGENVIAKARALAPVTKNDVDFLGQILGSIDTDPRALQELNAFMLAKSLVTLDKHNDLVDRVASTNPGLESKYNPLKVNLPEKLDKANGWLYGRAFQIMKENGHDVSRYKYNGTPVNEVEFNLEKQKPSRANAAPPPGLRAK